MMKLTELLDIESTRLDEGVDGVLRMKIPFLSADKATANGRVYPLAVLKSAISKLQKKLVRGLTYGSTSHPKERIEVDDVSHSIEDIQLEGKTCVATVKVLPTSRGKNLLAILRGGGKVGVSARGQGEVRTEAGQGIVKEGYELEGLDFCLNPASGMYAGMEMVCESAPLEENYTLSENDLDTRYWNAVRFANYQGTKEDLQAAIEDKEGRALLGTALERFRRARDAGYTGDFDSFVNSLPKEKK